MQSFRFYQPTKIHFGSGILESLDEIINQSNKNILIVSRPIKPYREKDLEKITKSLEKRDNKVYRLENIIPNPTTDIIEEGVKYIYDNAIDIVIAIGGGSCIDAAKIMAFVGRSENVSWDNLYKLDDPFKAYPKSDKSIPLYAITTTSGTGSHVTQAAVITKSSTFEKVTLFHPSLFPETCIIDPTLMQSLPKEATSLTLFDAFAHSFESYLSPIASAYTKSLSLNAIKIIIENSSLILNDPTNLETRENLAYADTLAGVCLSNAGAGAPHALGEFINGIRPEMPHGLTLALVYIEYLKTQKERNKAKILNVAKIFNPTIITSDNNEIDAFIEIFKKWLIQLGIQNMIDEQMFTHEELENIQGKLVFDLSQNDSSELKSIIYNSLINNIK